MTITILIITVRSFLSAQIIDIPDPKLETGIREVLEKPDGNITKEDMESLTEIVYGDIWETNLEGLQWAINLEKFSMGHEHRGSTAGGWPYWVLDRDSFLPLTGLKKLNTLNIIGRLDGIVLPEELSGLSTLSVMHTGTGRLRLPTGMSQLEELNLVGNRLTTFVLPESMSHLRTLNLSNNSITSLTIRGTKTSLTSLNLSGNHRLRDFSFLANLNNLIELDLSGIELSRLILPDGLDSLTSLDLSSNPIASLSVPSSMNIDDLEINGFSKEDITFYKPEQETSEGINLQRLGSWPPFIRGGNHLDIALTETHAFVANDKAGIHVFDVSDPSRLEWVGGYETPGVSSRIKVTDDFAYVLEKDRIDDVTNKVTLGGLRILDISDPKHPTSLGFLQSIAKTTSELEVQNNMVYLLSPKFGVDIIEVSDPSAPAHLGSYHSSGATTDGMSISGKLLAVVGSERLELIDVSDPTQPSSVGLVDGIKQLGSQVSISGNYVYLTRMANPWLATGEVGLMVYDTSQPFAPRLVAEKPYVETSGNLQTGGQSIGLEILGDLAIDVTSISSARGGTFGTGIRIFNLNDPSEPVQTASWDAGFIPTCMDASSNYVLLGFDNGEHRNPIFTGAPNLPENTLGILDLTNPQAPRWSDDYYTGGYSMAVSIEGNHAFLADGVGGLRVIDVSNPALPGLIGDFRFEDFAGNNYLFSDLSLENGYAIINIGLYGSDYSLGEQQRLINAHNPMKPHWTETDGLEIIDMHAPVQQVNLDKFTDIGTVKAVAVANNIAYVVTANRKLILFDVSNITNPALVGQIGFSGNPTSISVSGDIVYLGTHAGVCAFDVANPASPKLLGEKTGFQTLDLKTDENRIYVAAGNDGLIILDQVSKLRFGSPFVHHEDGLIRMPLLGTNVKRAIIQRSVDMTHWEDWQTIELDTYRNEVMDHFTSDGLYFYRARKVE